MFKKLKDAATKLTTKVESTVDPEFDALENALNNKFKLLKKYQEQIKKLEKDLQTVLDTQRQAATTLVSIYDEGMHGLAPASQFINQLNEVNEARVRAEEVLGGNIYSPLEAYLEQYKEALERVKERKKRLTAMDKYRAELNNLRAAPKPDAMKIDVTDVKLNHSTAAYHELNEELKRDLPNLLASLPLFLDPLFANSVDVQQNFAANFHNAVILRNFNISSINRVAHARLPYYLTTRELSSASKIFND